MISYTATGHTHIKGNKHINDHSDNMWEHYTKTKAMVLVFAMEVAMGPGAGGSITTSAMTWSVISDQTELHIMTS